MHRITRFRTREEAVENKNKGDRLFQDPYLNEYFIIHPIKYIWKEGEFEENFIIMPETLEECMELRPGSCQDCEHLPDRLGNDRSCQRRGFLLRRERMEIF